MSKQRLLHLLNPRRCFEQAAWVGNLFTCPVCGQTIAVGTNNSIFPFPKYKGYQKQLSEIPVQPEWYVPDNSLEELRQFMKNTFDSIGDFSISNSPPEDLEENEIERTEE